MMDRKQIKHKEDFTKISKIADKVIELSKEYGLPTREKFYIMMDFENVNNEIPLNLDLLLSPENEETLLHDYCGIYKNLNRTTLKLDENFLPRSAWNDKIRKTVKTLDNYFNGKSNNFSLNECYIFAEEICYEDFTCKIENGSIVFENPNADNVFWHFENTAEGRKNFVLDLYNTHKCLNHHNNNLETLHSIYERM